MNVQNESSIILQLERLFLTLTQESWKHNILENNLSQIKEPLKKFILTRGWESLTSKPLLTFIEHGIQHKNWKFRSTMITFITLLHEIAKSDAKPKNEKKLLLWEKGLCFIQELDPLFWNSFIDSDLRVVECCLKSLKAYLYNLDIEEVWFDYQTHNFRPPPINETTLNTIDIPSLYQRFLEIKPELHYTYFWTLVWFVVARVRLGGNTNLSSMIRKLTDQALQEPSLQNGYIHHPELYLTLLRLALDLSPEYRPIRWGNAINELLGNWKKNLNGELDEFFPEYFLENFGSVIISYRDLNMFQQFVNECVFNWDLIIGHSFLDRCIYCTYQELFPITLEAGWEEATRFLLRQHIEGTNEYYECGFPAMGGEHEDEDLIDSAIFWADYLAQLFTQYLDAGGALTLELLESLSRLCGTYYDELGDCEYFQGLRKWDQTEYALPSTFIALLSRLGQEIYHNRLEPMRDLCFKEQFLHPLHGMLHAAIEAKQLDWVPEIMTTLISSYTPLCRVELYQSRSPWSREPPKPPLERVPLIRAWDYYADYTDSDESFFNCISDLIDTIDEWGFPWTGGTRRELHLQLWITLLERLTPVLQIWGIPFEQIYQTHEPDVLLLLIDLLFYAPHYSKNWLQCFKNIGTLWAVNSFAPTNLQNYDTDETAWAALVLHGCAKNPDAEPLLIQYAQQVSHPPHHRALVLFALAMLETDATIFFPLSKWTPKSVRVIVVRILGTLQDKRALPHLIETSRDSHPGLRAYCAWALGEMQDTSALDTLLVLLEDEELRVSLEAIAALGKLNDSRAIPPLLELWAQLEEQKSHMGLVFLGGPHEIFDEWKQTASVVHKSLHQLGVTVAPLTEKEALKTHGINIGP